MKIPRIRAAVAALVVVASCGVLAQSSVAPKAIPPTSVVPQVKELREAVQLVELPKEIVIKGQQLHDSYFIGAEVLVFEAGATLVFSEKAFRERNNLIVAAKEVVMRDPGRPGRITWARSITPEGVGPASGQAPSGASGHGDGVPGQPGQAGVAGITGLSGRNAPNLTLFVTKIKGAPPTIDLLGQRGGQGGMGQRGGDGGHGHKGSPASASAFDCRSGAGYGGHGGPGGAGGTGGRGGEGGAGGTVTLVSLPEAFPALLQLVRVDVSGGAGGAGGDPGKGGPGGRGGAQGEKALPYCKDEPGRRGSDAAAGPDGGAGPTGAQGPQGDVVYTTLKKEVFETLFGAL